LNIFRGLLLIAGTLGSSLAVCAEPVASANYKEARFLVSRDLPIQVLEIQRFVSFQIVQPPKEICLPSTPNCWVVIFTAEGKDQDSGRITEVDRILSAPLVSESDARDYVSTLKNWEKFRNHLLFYGDVRLSYPATASLFLIQPNIMSFPKFLQDHKLIYRFNLDITHSGGFLDAEDLTKTRLVTDYKCPADGCSWSIEPFHTNGFFVKEPVYDFRVIANPKADR
jgi:hypothetical protein